MILLLGDIHGKYERVIKLINSFPLYDQLNTYKVVLLGDSGMNFFLDERDKRIKSLIQEEINRAKQKGIDVDIFFVRGNHECRPEDIETYSLIDTKYGKMWMENQFPNLFFFGDGFEYVIDGRQIMVIGGGNSSDFFSRMLNGEPFWNRESYSREEEEEILTSVSKLCSKELIVFSHVLPKEVVVEKKESIAGRSVEDFLSRVLNGSQVHISQWYSGHYHVDKKMDYEETDFYVVYNDVIEL